ncbi:DNA cytosine methyltransferase [Candidatus Magnetobacterium casense]|uniref:DNA cytosine methyltransferase n=1 Tax=Candidatus Magnetobacterium casense TaxID=1455061 RepID=UPI000A73385D|nr:DNA cytosine methyltransferase [Candidatus Magnetobacterium casensis]
MFRLKHSKVSEQVFRVLDIFAGAGGFSLGFEMAGAKVIGAVEIDKWACDTFSYNHPDAIVIQKDIQTLTDQGLLDAFETHHPNIIVSGPPCQGFSICNQNAGDPKDPRNSLFHEFLRVGHLFQPTLMVMENVPSLAVAKTAEGKKVLTIIESSLRDIGFYVYAATLQATDFGIPQIRNRLFVVASKIEISKPFPDPTHQVTSANQLSIRFSNSLQPCPTLWDAISDLPPLKATEGSEEQQYTMPPLTDYQKLLRNSSHTLFNHKAMNHGKRMVERFSTMQWGNSVNDVPDHLKPRRRNSQEIVQQAYDQNNRRMFPMRPCHTIPASFYANFVHPYQHRNFTAREGARIQSFPDWYRFLGKPTVVSHRLLAREERYEEKFLCQYNQIGNAVPPFLVKVLAHNILQQLIGREQCLSTGTT